MRLTLVRHGQTSWNIAGKAQGHADIPLDPAGLAQVATLEEAFQDRVIDLLLCSDLLRARQTVEPIIRASGALPFFTSHLRERSFGEWEGSHYSSISGRLESLVADDGTDVAFARPPGGESYADVWERVLPVLGQIDAAHGHVVVVGHGGSLAVLLAQLCHAQVETCRAFRFGNATITELVRRDDGSYYLERYNDGSHLARMNDGPP